MSKRTAFIALLLSLCGLLLFFIPFFELPFARFSLFDLISGALSGGNWTSSRIILITIFAALIFSNLALIVSLYNRGVIRRHA